MNFSLFALALLLTPVAHAQPAAKGSPMPHHTSGTFEPGVKPLPPDFSVAPSLGRMTINKQLHGGIEGTSIGQMLTAMSDTKVRLAMSLSRSSPARSTVTLAASR